MGTMKDTPDDLKLQQRAEKELVREAGSTEAFSEMTPEKMKGLSASLLKITSAIPLMNPPWGCAS
ncbi:MAG TPA: hypothetical protein HPP90_12250 [Deltaproteobacteria bacterium]|nr:hypothetical protein [Deltaproteobacteria bacterium]